MQLIEIESPDGADAFSAQFALPKDLPGPGLVIVPHIGGISSDMAEWVDHYAAKGFVTIVPDMFWRVLPGATPPTDEGRRLARERAEKVDPAQCMRDIETTIAYLKGLPECTGRVGVIGFCFGGKYAFLAATRLGITAAGAFHGVGIGEHVDEARPVAGRLSLHFGDSDPIVPMTEVNAISAALGSNPLVDICVYPGAAHNFTRKAFPSFDPHAASKSEERVDDVLRALF